MVPIRVHTLTLPMEDWIATWILSQPLYTILINERQMTKVGDVIMHLQYEDHMGLGYDYFNYLVKASRDEDEKREIIEDMESQFISPEVQEEDDKFDLFLPTTKPKKEGPAKTEKKSTTTKPKGKKVGGKTDE